jgi:F-type H+-transporting ATPase subunit b
MNGLIDPKQVLTQILGFLIMLWILRKYAWAPVLKMLEERRAKIAGEFAEAERRQKIAGDFEAARKAKADADATKLQLENELKGIEAKARQRLLEAVAEGQKVAGEIRAQAQTEAAARMARAEDDIAREREKAKEMLKEQVISLSMRTAEKILRQRLDDPAQRKLVGEFVEEVGAIR